MVDLPNAAILSRAAAAATLDARAAWKEALATPDEERTRSAFRQCVLAERIVRRAADTLPDGDERDQMIDGADRIEDAADALKAQLARIIEDGMVTNGTDGDAAAGDAPTRADAGYNPYRGGDGKFAPGPHSARHTSPRAPDAYNGRFAAGHGAAHDEGRVARVRSDATAIAKASGHADHAARGEHEATKERETIANEHRAVAVGHVAPVPTAKLAAYDAVHASVQERAARSKTTLDEHQGAAARALATLHAHPEHGDIHDPTDEHEQASTHLGHVAGHGGETSYGHEPAAPTGTYHEHAVAAQTALEALHGHQVRATAELKQADREHERAAGAMQREAELHADRGVRVAEGHPGHAAASAAAESMSAHEADRRGDIASEMRTRLEDAHGALREATRGTARAVRELAAVTGRAPQLAGK